MNIISLVTNFVYKGLKALGKKPSDNIILRLPYTGIINVDSPYGRFQMNGTGKWIENALFWHGLNGYEPGTTAVFLMLAKNSKSIIDIGANTGLFSLLARKAAPNAIIYAFEPLPYFCDLLKKNNSLNKAGILIHEAAIAGRDGWSTLYYPGEGQGNLYSATLHTEHYAHHQDTQPQLLQVRTCTLQAFFNEYQIRNVDLIKVDAEKNDVEAIESMGSLLAEMRPNIIIEIQDSISAEKLANLLAPLNYCYMGISDHGCHQWLPKPEGQSFLNFLCVPAEKRQWLQQLMINAELSGDQKQ